MAAQVGVMGRYHGEVSNADSNWPVATRADVGLSGIHWLNDPDFHPAFDAWSKTVQPLWRTCLRGSSIFTDHF